MCRPRVVLYWRIRDPIGEDVLHDDRVTTLQCRPLVNTEDFTQRARVVLVCLQISKFGSFLGSVRNLTLLKCVNGVPVRCVCITIVLRRVRADDADDRRIFAEVFREWVRGLRLAQSSGW